MLPLSRCPAVPLDVSLICPLPNAPTPSHPRPPSAQLSREFLAFLCALSTRRPADPATDPAAAAALAAAGGGGGGPAPSPRVSANGIGSAPPVGTMQVSRPAVAAAAAGSLAPLTVCWNANFGLRLPHPAYCRLPGHA